MRLISDAIIQPELQSCKQTVSLVNEMTQSREQVRRLIDNKLKGDPGT